MTFTEMMNNVIKRFGFENDTTIYFCRMIEKIEQESNPEYCKAMVEGFYNAIMR